MRKLILMLFTLCSLPAMAASLTPAQTSALRTLVANEPSLAQAVQTGDDATIANWLNADASPTFYVYRSSLARSDITSGVSVDGTTFTWAGNGYITRSVGERDAFRDMFSATGTVNPALANIQSAFTDIFSGAGNGAANRAHIASISKRIATRAERALANTSGGDGGSGSPAVLTFEGLLSPAEASALR